MAVRAEPEAGPRLRGDQIVFRYRDRRRTLVAVRLKHELTRPRSLDFRRVRPTLWEVELARPNADRLEYMLELEFRGGRYELILDPANPLRAPGAFGDKSVVESPGYRPPAWLDEDAPPGDLDLVELRSRLLRASVPAILWSSAGAGHEEPLPLLVAHDGPEYAEYSSLVRFLDAMWADGRLPTMRAALLPPPGDRNQTYSASARYAKALALELLPALRARAPVHAREPIVVMGASLGALAALHAHRLYPDSVGGLFLQSGSYFRQRLDRQEAGFVRFRRITRFVGDVLAGKSGRMPIPVSLTCGTVEENLPNNRLVAQALAEQGYEVSFREIRDAHNWTAWRDAFEPALTDLLERVWG